MLDYYRRDNCRLCESNNLLQVMHFPPTPIGDEYVSAQDLNKKQSTYGLDLIFCKACGFVQIPDVVSPELLYRNYTYETNVSLNLAEHFQKYADSIVNLLKLPSQSVVYEIGCNDGTFLQCFKNLGMKTIGIEPATRISQKAAAKGLHIVNDFFNHELAGKLLSEYGNGKVICANNVLANIDDLKGFFKGIHSLLADDGVFIFESGYMIDLINNDVIDNIYHEHLSYFSIYPLAHHLKDHGLELFHAEHVATKGGSMRYFIQKIGATREVTTQVGNYLSNEIEQGFNESSKFVRFEKKHLDEKEKLLTLLKDLKHKGKRIAGFGASVGVTSLLYFYEVQDYISFLADDNIIKQGQFSPGMHIPVCAPSRLYDDNIDYIVCFPWRYIEPIRKKNLKFVENGGKFILPLPEVKIL